ncbi:hypothetical protein [uncultured Acetobacteroides sp.]|uniref:beta strand repeat-containing protein n=1 Tax=uncultured Acetobacteroides sp. TaxID=1760811 RepID=UPI0029F55A46|nr:hypothetical protein [uncultured Acetobacteroides sp.]
MGKGHKTSALQQLMLAALFILLLTIPRVAWGQCSCSGSTWTNATGVTGDWISSSTWAGNHGSPNPSNNTESICISGNVVLNNAAATFLSNWGGSITVCGTLEVKGDMTVLPNLTVYGTLKVDGNLTVNGATFNNATVAVGKNFVANNGGSVNFSGNGTSTLSVGGSFTSNTSTVISGYNIGVNGDVTANSNEIKFLGNGSNTLTVGGSLTSNTSTLISGYTADIAKDLVSSSNPVNIGTGSSASKVTVHGNLSTSSTPINVGASGEFLVHGNWDVKSGSNSTITGTMAVKGSLTADQGVDITNTGNLLIFGGAKITGGSANIQGDLLVAGKLDTPTNYNSGTGGNIYSFDPTSKMGQNGAKIGPDELKKNADLYNQYTQYQEAFGLAPLSVTLTASVASPVCAGTEVTFTAKSTKATSYTFYVNGAATPSQSGTSKTYAYKPANGDKVSVVASDGTTTASATSEVYSVNPLPSFTGYTFDKLAVCAGSDGAVVMSSSESGISYQLYDGVGAVGISQTGTGNELTISIAAPAATATYRVVATNPTTGCTASLPNAFTLAVNTPPSFIDKATSAIYPFTAPAVCAGSDGTVVMGGSEAGISYQLYNGATAVGAPSVGTGSSVSFTIPSPAATASYNLVATNPTTGCTASLASAFELKVNPLPSLTGYTFDKLAVCAGSDGKVTMSASELNTSYQLYKGSVAVGDAVSGTGAAVTFTIPAPSATAAYSVKATSSTGCSAILANAFELKVNPLPNVALTSDAAGAVCGGSPVTFEATAGMSAYTFMLDSGSITRIDNAAVSSYTATSLAGDTRVWVVATDAKGCVGTSKALTVAVYPNPTVSLSVAGGSTVCEGAPVKLSASGAGSSYLGLLSTIASYEFLVNGASVQVGDASKSTLTYGMPAGSPVPVAVKVTDSRGCSSRDEVSLTVNPKPAAAIQVTSGSTTICKGDKVTLSASGGSLYQFTVGTQAAGVLGTESTTETTSLANGERVSVLVTDGNGCSATAQTQPFTVKDLPTVTLTADKAKICAGDAVTFTAAPATYSAYTFTLDGTSVAGPSTAYAYKTTTLGNQSAVTVRVKDAATGCWGESAPVKTTVTPLPVVTLGIEDNSNIPNDNQVCKDSKVTLVAPSGGDSYSFELNGKVLTPVGSSNRMTVDLANLAGYTVNVGSNKLKVTMTANGCSASSTMESLRVYKRAGKPTVDGKTLVWSWDDATQTYSATGISLPDSCYWRLNPVASGAITNNWNNSVDVTWSRFLNSSSVIAAGYNTGCGVGPESDPLNVTTFQAFGPPSQPSSSSSSFCVGSSIEFKTTNQSLYFGKNNWEIYNSVSNKRIATYTGYTTYAWTSSAVGTYKVRTKYDGDDRWSDFYEFTVEDVIPATITMSTNNVCPGTTITFTAPTGAKKYRFYRIRGGVEANLPNQPQAENFISVSATTNMALAAAVANGDRVGVQVISSCGAPTATSDAVVVHTDITPTISTSKSYACFNDAGSIALTATDGGSKYEWLVDGVKVGETAAGSYSGVVPSALSVGAHQLQVYVTYCSRMASDPIPFTVLPSPSGSLSIDKPSPICAGTALTLTATKGYDRYKFFINGISQGEQLTASNPTANQLLLSPTANSTYTVSVYGCGVWSPAAPSIAMVVNDVPPQPSLLPASPVVCPGESITLTAPAGYDGYQFSIGGSAGAEVGQNTVAISSSDAGKDIVVKAKNGCGWSAASTPVSVALRSLPSYTWEEHKDGVCAGCTYEYRLSNTTATYSWSIRTDNSGMAIDPYSDFVPANPAGRDVAIHFGSNASYYVGNSIVPINRYLYVKISDGGCSVWETKKITIYRVPITGSPYHISNSVAK